MVFYNHSWQMSLHQKVFLCENFQGVACQDSTTRVGYLSPASGFVPIQFEAELQLNDHLSILNNVAWSMASRSINNAMVNFHYEPQANHIINAGYGFLVDGDPVQLAGIDKKNTNLHQIRISYAWPYSDHWRGVGAWNYNISHHFAMSYLFGLQYDDCCVALRLLGGRSYLAYNPVGAPAYANNIYLQVLLKGLGSVANNDPFAVIKSFLPTFRDEFNQ